VLHLLRVHKETSNHWKVFEMEQRLTRYKTVVRLSGRVYFTSAQLQTRYIVGLAIWEWALCSVLALLVIRTLVAAEMSRLQLQTSSTYDSTYTSTSTCTSTVLYDVCRRSSLRCSELSSKRNVTTLTSFICTSQNATVRSLQTCSVQDQDRISYVTEICLVCSLLLLRYCTHIKNNQFCLSVNQDDL